MATLQQGLALAIFDAGNFLRNKVACLERSELAISDIDRQRCVDGANYYAAMHFDALAAVRQFQIAIDAQAHADHLRNAIPVR